jgi:hypothetical protein
MMKDARAIAVGLLSGSLLLAAGFAFGVDTVSGDEASVEAESAPQTEPAKKI